LDKQEKDENAAAFSDEKGSISVISCAGSSVKITDSEISSLEQENFEKNIGNETVVENGGNGNTVSAGTVHLSIPYDGIISFKNRKNSKNSHSQCTKVGGDSMNIVGTDGQSSSEKDKRKDRNDDSNNNNKNNDDDDVIEIIDIDIDSDKDDINTDKTSDKINEKDDSNSLWLPLTALSVQKSAYVPQNLKTAVKFNLSEGQVQNDNDKVKTFFWNRFSQKIQVNADNKNLIYCKVANIIISVYSFPSSFPLSPSLNTSAPFVP
jgi:hypothetical protein